ncbi:MAG: hypothetical protein U0K87_04415 [Ruminococcus sp.]|nr:hypothetical protein [Ruminococcus sp.]
MTKVFRRLLAFVLVVSLLLTSNISVFAATKEEYLSELRLVYAEDYSEAKEILKETKFKDYEILNENLNEGTKKIGVWLAYKTTTNIEDAITDLSVMQMQGGYQEGNYQEMIKKSYDDYVKMSKIYMQAVDYFAEAYDAGHFLTEAAYRQLNLYTSITDPALGIKIPSFDGELLGDIFYESIDELGLATMFMQGNSYALSKIRSLLAMGVSYNEDGKTYLEKVAEAAKEMTDDPEVYSDKKYDDLMPIISVTISGFKDKFKELSAHEADLNYEDEDYTEDELAYMEIYGIAKMMNDVKYLEGKTLYEFCLDYDSNSKDYSPLYPLAAALNDGQVAMTKVAHYQDVIRYSMPSVAEEEIDAEIAKLEEKYGERPFNIYTGVDRSIFTGTFALTNAAYRADAYTDTDSLLDSLFGDQLSLTIASLSLDVVGLAIMAGGLYHYKAYDLPARSTAVANETQRLFEHHSELLGNNIIKVLNDGNSTSYTYNQFLTNCLSKYNLDRVTLDQLPNMSALDKYLRILERVGDENGYMFFETDKLSSVSSEILSRGELDSLKAVADKLEAASHKLGERGHMLSGDEVAKMAVDNVGSAVSLTTTLLYIGGGIAMLSSAIVSGIAIYNHYHPDYDDIPAAMVDVIDTVDGDRYIKYDVVYEAVENDKRSYSAGDLNAFAAQRWNALYYTKSYEAGKPLLADEFSISIGNNKPKTNYAPVHRFGEVVCYDLNKYNFNKNSSTIYLSVKQSKNNKSAVADVPEVVGSLISNGYLFLIGGLGAFVGVGGTLGTQAILKKKRKK